MIPYLIFLKKERVYFVRNKIIFSLVFLAGLFFISLLAPKIIMTLRTHSIIVEINEKIVHILNILTLINSNLNS